MRLIDSRSGNSQELRFTQWALAFVALAKPFHYAVTVEFLSTRLASFLRQLPVAVHDIKADRALLHSC